MRLLAPLAADLATWRLANGRPVDEELGFGRGDGEMWRDHDWRRRVFDPLAARVGAPGMRLYDLRHAFCSLLIGEGRSVVEVARQAGHAPTMTLGTYAHVMADLDGGDRLSPADAIEPRPTRECPESVRLRARRWRRGIRSAERGGFAGFAGEPSSGLEPETPSLPWKPGGFTGYPGVREVR